MRTNEGELCDVLSLGQPWGQWCGLRRNEGNKGVLPQPEMGSQTAIAPKCPQCVQSTAAEARSQRNIEARCDEFLKSAIAWWPHGVNGPVQVSFMFSCGYSVSPNHNHGA
jgi:hypothetical protein